MIICRNTLFLLALSITTQVAPGNIISDIVRDLIIGKGTTETIERTAILRPLLTNNTKQDNNKIIQYFKDNKDLIDTFCVRTGATSKHVPCHPVYLAMICNNYEVTNWFLDNGVKLTSDWNKERFIQLAILKDSDFSGTHIHTILEENPDLIIKTFIFDKTGMRQTLTPLDYAKNCKNNNALETMTALVKKQLDK